MEVCMRLFKFLTLGGSYEVLKDKDYQIQVMYGVPSGPFSNPPRTISTLLVFVIGLATLIVKRKSSWKVKAIIIIITLIGMFIALNINWNALFGDVI